uniref:Uncharacterized protein n=1 Tax=Panagrolaimus sp. PS1159 TaxID=55785 RepID=A0AC35GLG4_9BILA
MRQFELLDIPEDFNIERFYGYIKKNNKTQIRLHFSQLISNQYKNRVKLIIDEILKTKNHNYKVPHIVFPGMNESSIRKLYNLFC